MLYVEFKHQDSFEAVFVNEMKAFIGILIIMGINPAASLKDYWSEKYSCLRNAYISAIMSRSRFEKILCFLHLADPNQDYTG